MVWHHWYGGPVLSMAQSPSIDPSSWATFTQQLLLAPTVACSLDHSKANKDHEVPICIWIEVTTLKEIQRVHLSLFWNHLILHLLLLECAETYKYEI